MNKKELKEHIKSIFEKDLNPKPKPRPDKEDELNDELDSTGIIDEPNQGGADIEDIQQSLQSAYKKSQGLGDNKLAQQIANTITYFTRNHVLAKQEVAEIHRLQELAGIEEETETSDVHENIQEQPVYTFKFSIGGNMSLPEYHDMICRILLENDTEAFNQSVGQTDDIEII